MGSQAQQQSLSKIQFSFLPWVECYDPNENAYTAYVIEVKDITSKVSIVLNKRYTAFEQLHQKIIGRLASEFTLQLPGKRFLNKDPVFLEERKTQLTAYLTSLFSLPKVQADEVPEVQEFLELPRLVERIEMKSRCKPIVRPSSQPPTIVKDTVIVFDKSQLSNPTESTSVDSQPTSSSSSSSSSPTRKTLLFDLTELERILLKELLLDRILTEELALFFATPAIATIEEKTLLLRFGREIIQDFPGFKNDLETKRVVDDLLLQGPLLTKIGSKATKTDWVVYIKSVFFLIFSVQFRTTEEDKFLGKLAQQRGGYLTTFGLNPAGPAVPVPHFPAPSLVPYPPPAPYPGGPPVFHAPPPSPYPQGPGPYTQGPFPQPQGPYPLHGPYPQGPYSPQGPYPHPPGPYSPPPALYSPVLHPATSMGPILQGPYPPPGPRLSGPYPPAPHLHPSAERIEPKRFKMECAKCYNIQVADAFRTVIYDLHQYTLANPQYTQSNNTTALGALVFDVLRRVPRLENAPIVFRTIFGCFKQMFALWLQTAADETNVKKGKMLLRMTPMLGIQMTLKFWDPVFLFKQSMNFSFARPFGTRSIAMHAMAYIIEMGRTQDSLKDWKKKYPSWVKRVKPITDRFYPQLKEEITLEMINSNTGKQSYKTLFYNKALLAALREELDKNNNGPEPMTVNTLLQIVWTQVRILQKEDLLEQVGDKKLFSIAKHMVVTTQNGFACLNYVDLAGYSVKLYDILRSLNVVAEKELKREKQGEVQRRKAEAAASGSSTSSSQAKKSEEEEDRPKKKIDLTKYSEILDMFASWMYEVSRDVMLADAKSNTIGKKAYWEIAFDWWLRKVMEGRQKEINMLEDIVLPVLPHLEDHQVAGLLAHLKKIAVTGHLFQHPEEEKPKERKRKEGGGEEEEEDDDDEDEDEEEEVGLTHTLSLLTTQFLSHLSERLYPNE